MVRPSDGLDRRLVGDAIAFAWARRRRSIVLKVCKGTPVMAKGSLASITRSVTSLVTFGGRINFCGIRLFRLFPLEEMRHPRGGDPRGIFLFVHRYVIHTNVLKRQCRQWYFKGCPFRAQVEHPPNLLLFPVHPSPHSSSARDTIFFTYFISIQTLSSCFFQT